MFCRSIIAFIQKCKIQQNPPYFSLRNSKLNSSVTLTLFFFLCDLSPLTQEVIWIPITGERRTGLTLVAVPTMCILIRTPSESRKRGVQTNRSTRWRITPEVQVAAFQMASKGTANARTLLFYSATYSDMQSSSFAIQHSAHHVNVPHNTK